MKTILDYLEHLGFSRIEANLYVILLKSGQTSVAELAEKADMNRTAAYGYIHALLEKGVAVKVKGAGNKIEANPPEHLRFLVEQKANVVKKLELQLPAVIASLTSAFPQGQKGTDSEIKYFKGKIGVKAIYEDCLRANEMRSYFNAAELEKVFPENIALFSDSFNKNPHIKMYEILEDSQESKEQLKLYVKRELENPVMHISAANHIVQFH